MFKAVLMYPTLCLFILRAFVCAIPNLAQEHLS